MNILRESHASDPLQALKDYILNLKVTGNLELRGIEAGFKYDEMSHIYDDSVIRDLKVNGLKVGEFQEKLYKAKLSIITFVRNKINVENSALNNYRVYKDAIEKVNSILQNFRSKPLVILFTNRPDVRLVRSTKLRQLQTQNLHEIYEIIINQILQELITELSEELTFFKEISSTGKKVIRRSHSVQAVPSEFKELFNNPLDAEPCLDILRQIDPPFIDSSNNCIRRNKGIYGVWLEVLISKGTIKKLSRVQIAKVLNATINNLDISADAKELNGKYKTVQDFKEDILVLFSNFSMEGRIGKKT